MFFHKVLFTFCEFRLIVTGASEVKFVGAKGDVQVECYSGYRADERPLWFLLRGRPYQVEELEDRWYSPGAIYFRVRADDGNNYVLRHDEQQDVWTLDGFRATQRGAA
jgi:hypothetical protein